MPNWTDETGYDWFGKLRCKRCNGRFDAEKGEVPEHDCIGGRFKSGPDPDGVTSHTPIWVGPLDPDPVPPPKRRKK